MDPAERCLRRRVALDADGRRSVGVEGRTARVPKCRSVRKNVHYFPRQLRTVQSRTQRTDGTDPRSMETYSRIGNPVLRRSRARGTDSPREACPVAGPTRDTSCARPHRPGRSARAHLQTAWDVPCRPRRSPPLPAATLIGGLPIREEMHEDRFCSCEARSSGHRGTRSETFARIGNVIRPRFSGRRTACRPPPSRAAPASPVCPGAWASQRRHGRRSRCRRDRWL